MLTYEKNNQGNLTSGPKGKNSMNQLPNAAGHLLINFEFYF